MILAPTFKVKPFHYWGTITLDLSLHWLLLIRMWMWDTRNTSSVSVEICWLDAALVENNSIFELLTCLCCYDPSVGHIVWVWLSCHLSCRLDLELEWVTSWWLMVYTCARVDAGKLKQFPSVVTECSPLVPFCCRHLSCCFGLFFLLYYFYFNKCYSSLHTTLTCHLLLCCGLRAGLTV